MDANATDRVLLQSCKPSLHTNADCTALVAAVVSRQISVVRLLLKVKKFNANFASLECLMCSSS